MTDPITLPHDCTCPADGEHRCPVFGLPLPPQARAVCRGERGEAEQVNHQRTWAEMQGVPISVPEPTEQSEEKAKRPRMGLGDWLYHLFMVLGIHSLVQWWTNGNCQCQSRRVKLNKWWFQRTGQLKTALTAPARLLRRATRRRA